MAVEEQKDATSEINNEEDTKENPVTFNCHSSWFHSDIIKDRPLNVGEFCSFPAI